MMHTQVTSDEHQHTHIVYRHGVLNSAASYRFGFVQKLSVNHIACDGRTGRQKQERFRERERVCNLINFKFRCHLSVLLNLIFFLLPKCSIKLIILGGRWLIPIRFISIIKKERKKKWSRAFVFNSV